MTQPRFQTQRAPLTRMSWTPDPPSQSLSLEEYNHGLDIESDLRGIKPQPGERAVLSLVPDTETPIFVTSGYRSNGVYWWIVATRTDQDQGRWYGITTAGITNITPGVGGNPDVSLPGYTNTVPITAEWNGTLLLINDSTAAPMYLLPTVTEIRRYDSAPDNYVWNYNPDWSNLRAGWMRLYSTPNVGSILIAGNLTADVISTGTTITLPYTVRWSQSFGIDSGPTTWEPTLTNTANELEVPVRGPVIDGFVLGANFYIQSYWDTMVLSPLNYQSSLAPILGVRNHTQGRGVLNENCWAAGDGVVFGLDSRDIWAFSGQGFRSIADQRVLDTWQADQHPQLWPQTFMINNTRQNQIEIYYPSLASTGGCDRMISYRYDTDVWNPPAQVAQAAMATEGPRVIDQAGDWITQDSQRRIFYVRNQPGGGIIQTREGTTLWDGQPRSPQFRRDNIGIGPGYSYQNLIHRIWPEISGTGNIQVQISSQDSAGGASTPLSPQTMSVTSDSPWVQMPQNAVRLHNIAISSTDSTDQWNLTALNWQYQTTQDQR